MTTIFLFSGIYRCFGECDFLSWIIFWLLLVKVYSFQGSKVIFVWSSFLCFLFGVRVYFHPFFCLFLNNMKLKLFIIFKNILRLFDFLLVKLFLSGPSSHNFFLFLTAIPQTEWNVSFFSGTILYRICLLALMLIFFW